MTSSNENKKAVGTAGGAAIGTGIGLTSSAVIVSASGTVAGLSGAGITSGLAAVGGTILGGAAILTCGTVIVAGLGAYAGYKIFSKKDD